MLQCTRQVIKEARPLGWRGCRHVALTGRCADGDLVAANIVRRKEKEQLVSVLVEVQTRKHDRPSECAAEVVELVGSRMVPDYWGCTELVEIVVCVEEIIAHKFVGAAVKLGSA